MYFSKGLNSMKWLLGGLLHMLMLVALTATADETISTEFSEYLYVWAADAGGTLTTPSISCPKAICSSSMDL
jgi:hypothetical protein